MLYTLTLRDKATGAHFTARVEGDNFQDAKENAELEHHNCQVMSFKREKVVESTYIPTRILRKREEERLMVGIGEVARGYNVKRGQMVILDNPGFRPCSCEDYPCCGH